MKINNKGMSLVELIIAIGMFGFVMIALFSVLTISSRTFSRGNQEITVQNEATSFMNQLENIVAEAKYGVYACDEADYSYMFVFKDDSYDAIWRDKNTDMVYYAERKNATIKSQYADLNKNSKTVIADMGSYTLADFKNEVKLGNIDVVNKKAQFIIAENVSRLGVIANNDYGYVSVYLTVTADKSTIKFAAAKNINIRNISKGVVSSKTNGGSYSSGDTTSEIITGNGEAGGTEGTGTTGGTEGTGTTGGTEGTGTTGGTEGTGTTGGTEGTGTTGGTEGSGTTGNPEDSAVKEKYMIYNITLNCTSIREYCTGTGSVSLFNGNYKVNFTLETAGSYDYELKVPLDDYNKRCEHPDWYGSNEPSLNASNCDVTISYSKSESV